MSQNLRNLVEYVGERIEINEDLIDLYDMPTKKIPDYKPSVEMPDFDKVSVLYLDIETYSDNKLVIDYIIQTLKYGRFNKKDDKYIYDFLYNQIVRELENYFGEYANVLIDIKNYLTVRYENECSYDEVSEEDDSYILDNLIDFINDARGKWEKLDTDIDPKGALHPGKAIVALIGLMNERGQNIVVNCINNEAGGIKEYFRILEKKKPQILAHFNGFSFDMPFIAGRCKALRISHPFKIDEKETVFKTAQMFGEQMMYKSFRYSPDGYAVNKNVAIIDLFHQTLAWDFVNRKLTAFNLKEVPLQLKLRKEARLVLSYKQMQACVREGNIETLKQYLIYDLEDSKLLGDFLLPDIYYQKELLPHWSLQSLSTGGLGSKWNDILLTEYKRRGLPIPKVDPTFKFEGGLVGSTPGLFRNVGKWDFKSMYPHIMELYQIYSYKDDICFSLGVLKYLKNKRIEIKDRVNTDTSLNAEEKRKLKKKEGYLKVWINAAYGFLATKGKEFNDYGGGALVTACGRALLKRGIQLCRENGGIPVNFDTDGLYFHADDNTFGKHQKIVDNTQENLPKGFIIEFEVKARLMYVPPASDGNSEEGLRKNYIIIFEDGSIKANGKFRKRDKCHLEKTFTVELVEAYLNNKHEEYYLDIMLQLMSKTYPVEKMATTQKIKINEKRKVELGLGKAGDVITIWKAPDKPIYGKRGQLLKKSDIMWTNLPEEIDWEYYINMVQEMYDEFIQCPKY